MLVGDPGVGHGRVPAQRGGLVAAQPVEPPVDLGIHL
jgi:hypothetical protein